MPSAARRSLLQRCGVPPGCYQERRADPSLGNTEVGLAPTAASHVLLPSFLPSSSCSTSSSPPTTSSSLTTLHLLDSQVGVANSCLHVAAARNDAAAVQLLLQHGAAPSAAGKGGFSPLAVAARAGALLAIPPLLEAGANPDAPTAAGKSARELAVINKRLQAIELFDAR